MSFNVALPSEGLEARKLDLSLKRKGASSERAKDGAAEGGVRFNSQWHQLATRVASSNVHRAETSAASEDVLESVGDEVNSEEAMMASAGMQARLEKLSGKGSALPESARAFFEPRLGVSLSQVRLHTGAEADTNARELDAHAFTAGRGNFFAAGGGKAGGVGGERPGGGQTGGRGPPGGAGGGGGGVAFQKGTKTLEGEEP